MRLPPWAYAAASIAVAAIVALGIWGIRSDNRPMRLEPLGGPTVASSEGEGGLPTTISPATAPVAIDYDPYPAVHDDSDNVLAAAEDELYAMSQRSPGDAPAILLMGDTDEQ